MVTPSAPHAKRQLFTTRQRTVVDALARCIVPHAFPAAADAGDPSERHPTPVSLTTQIEERLLEAPVRQRDDFLAVLRLLDSGAARLTCGGAWRPWESLDPVQRAARFARWGNSPVPLARTAYQAVRRLVLAVHYTTPEGTADMGALPPLHHRLPTLPWEGAVIGGTTRDDEPVARAESAESTPERRASPDLVPGSITRGDQLTGDVQLTADVVIVGSGAGGAVAAARLAEAGRAVVVLEEGSWIAPAELDDDERRLVPRLYADQGMRATEDLAFSLLQGVGVGGGTRVNWMIMLRTPAHVLEEWDRRFGLGAFSPAALAPVFARIEREVHATRVPDDAHSPTNRILLDGARRLGWRVSAALLNATGCVRAGTCSLGCSHGAKQDAVATFLPRAFAAGARLFADAAVTRLEQRERASAGVRHPMRRVHAVVLDPVTRAPRGSLIVDAPVVILAAGAVGTPAILQRSGMGGGAVGRFLRLHPTTCVMGEYDHPTYPLAGLPLSVMCDEFVARGHNGYGFWIESPALTPALAATATSGFGASHRDDMRRLRQTAPFITLVRDGADTAVSNGSVNAGRDGRVRIRYRLGPSDTENLVASLEAAARLHFAAGARTVRTLHTVPLRLTGERDIPALRAAGYAPNRLSLFSAHVNGTCRMGNDAALTGATPEGERHGVRGVYICDGSLLPTAPGVNPQETIMALATVIAEGIAARAG